MTEPPRFCIITKEKKIYKCSNLDKDDNCKLQKGKYSSYSAQYWGCPLKSRGDMMNTFPRSCAECDNVSIEIEHGCATILPMTQEIGYNRCSNALLKMWVDGVLTDAEYYKIADKLNQKWGVTE